MNCFRNTNFETIPSSTKKYSETEKRKNKVINDLQEFDPVQLKEPSKTRTAEDDAWELLNAQ